jgi:hypothetical protein
MKYFIVTVDTEGDNLWEYKKGNIITTENSLFIPRFQALCEQYNLKPVWLTNYEMVCDERYVDYIKSKSENGLCEIGIHVHAWNNPPHFELQQKYNGNPYLIEYPDKIMHDKFASTYNLIIEKFGIVPKSHRAGRWAMDKRYFKLLNDFDIRIDCSVTPGINWNNIPGETMMGTDYSKYSSQPFFIDNVLEVPMTIIKTYFSKRGSICHKIKVLLNGENVWLRPASSTLNEMKQICKTAFFNSNQDYVEFMVHSSELMPGGSPYFKDEKSINQLYIDLEELFAYVKDLGFEGITLDGYYNKINNL